MSGQSKTGCMWDSGTIRQLERSSIRRFMEANRQYLCGRVLDFGAGTQPYKDLVDGEYVPYDKGQLFPTSVGVFDAVMCNQVLEYIPEPTHALQRMKISLKSGGHLVMTYPTNWDEVEPDDLWRFTKAGMDRLMKLVGLDVCIHERRAQVDLGGFIFPLGYGIVARRL
jgi:SAM-dependent methyltransferase